MNKYISTAVSVVFLAIITVFGGITALKMKGALPDIISNNSLAEMPSAAEACIADHFWQRNNWINVNGLFQRMAGTKVIRDAGDIDVFRLSNGQLTYEYPDCDMAYAAGEVSGLAEFAKSSGAEFIYVQLPCKVYSDGLMPPGTHSYGNADSDEIIGALRENGVDVLDLRENIRESGFKYEDLFFNTDHHWKPSTALWAAGVIADRLSETVDGYDYDSKLYDTDNYDSKVYKEWFLGSLGRRTGIFYGGVDDFETLIPKFSTKYRVYTESQSEKGTPREKSGSFKKALMRLKYLKKKNYFSPETYFTYMGNEFRLADVVNMKADNEKKILILRDSFSCTLLPYLSLSAGECVAIDMRYHKKIKIKEYIRDNDFDAVIVAYNPSMFREDGAFDFDR